MRVSAQHQCISDKGYAPAPCSDLAQPEPISPGSNRCKRYDGGLCRERLPGGTQKTPALSIDRHGTGESYDCQVAKKTSEATSPLAIRCTSAQRPTPVRNG